MRGVCKVCGHTYFLLVLETKGCELKSHFSSLPPVASSTFGSPVSFGQLPAPLVKLPARGQVFGQPLQLLQSCFTAKVPTLRVHRLCPPRDLYPSADTTTPEHTSGDKECEYFPLSITSAHTHTYTTSLPGPWPTFHCLE